MSFGCADLYLNVNFWSTLTDYKLNCRWECSICKKGSNQKHVYENLSKKYDSAHTANVKKAPVLLVHHYNLQANSLNTKLRGGSVTDGGVHKQIYSFNPEIWLCDNNLAEGTYIHKIFALPFIIKCVAITHAEIILYSNAPSKHSIWIYFS